MATYNLFISHSWAYSDTYDGLIKLLDAKSHFSYRIVSLAGILLCYAWYRLVRSYKDINSGKFKVVHEIEKELLIQRLFRSMKESVQNWKSKSSRCTPKV